MKNDLISRSALLHGVDKTIAHMRNKAGEDKLLNSAINLVQNTRDFIAQAPAVDAVEIVRCRDCIYYEIGKDYLPYCNHPDSGIAYFPDEDDFCSYGERRADDATN